MTDQQTFTPPDDEDDEIQLADSQKVQGIQRNWNTEADWDGYDYRAIPTPNPQSLPYSQWDTDERRAWLFEQLREHGTWRNVPHEQTEVGDWFDVSQQTISNDLKEIRRYIRFHAGDKAISMSEMVAQKAVGDLMEDDPYKAWSVQREFNEFLFELGRLDRAPDKKQVHNINESISDDSLSDDEKDHFADLAEKLEQANDSQADEPIDVEAKEVEDG